MVEHLLKNETSDDANYQVGGIFPVLWRFFLVNDSKFIFWQVYARSGVYTSAGISMTACIVADILGAMLLGKSNIALFAFRYTFDQRSKSQPARFARRLDGMNFGFTRWMVFHSHWNNVNIFFDLTSLRSHCCCINSPALPLLLTILYPSSSASHLWRRKKVMKER